MVKLLQVKEIGSVKNSCSDILRLFWWLEVKTVIPSCTYYFGPFSSKKEASSSQYEYIKDLLQKKVHGTTVEVRQLEPRELVIYED